MQTRRHMCPTVVKQRFNDGFINGLSIRKGIVCFRMPILDEVFSNV